MYLHRRPVRWNDVDAASIVYFPRFFDYCHDAIEAMFDALDGGYPHLTMRRRIGVPTVHLECDFTAPLAYGDTCLVEVSVARIGRSSVHFEHVLRREADAVVCARVRHIIAVCDLSTLASIEIPSDVRAVLEQHAAVAARNTVG